MTTAALNPGTQTMHFKVAGILTMGVNWLFGWVVVAQTTQGQSVTELTVPIGLWFGSMGTTFAIAYWIGRAHEQLVKRKNP